ncbi:MAG: helix-turn-helix transcriptional regulator [Lachnospiraceae bacterium]|nr:helix-turn-helix transcriptional regulator [Lachnospiraceae bacterium]
MTLLERIKVLCLKNSISLAALEKKLNLGNGTLSRWDTSSPSIDKIQKVSDYFNVSIDYLVGQENKYNHQPYPVEKLTVKPRDFSAQFEEIAEILGYKVRLENGNISSIEYKGKEIQLETQKVINLMDTIQSFIKFTLQEAIKDANEEYGEDFPTIVVAARGGRYKLDKKAAQKLAQSAAKAPNRAHDKELF